MVTAAGSGYSRWGDIAVTRWREDVTRDSWGSYLFLRDMDTGAVWSAGHQPSGVEADSYEVTYSEDHVEFSRRDGSIATEPDDRRLGGARRRDPPVSLTNLGSQRREIELTSYAEIALATQAADVAHPAFQNLFVQTEFVPEHRRAAGDAPAEIERRTADLGRPRRGGRGGGAAASSSTRRIAPASSAAADSVRSPVSVIDGRPLSNTVGAVLDPIFSLRCRVSLASGRDRPRDLLDGRRRVARGGARPRRQVPRAGHLRAGRDPGLDAGAGPAPSPRHRVGRGAPLPAPRQPDPVLGPVAAAGARPARRNERGAPGLWPYGISGDLPIVAGAHRRGRGPRHRPPAAPGPRVLAAEAARRRPRDHQRARRHLRPGPPGRARDAGAHQPVDARPRGPHGPRRRVHPARRSAVRPRTGRCSRRPPGPCC